MTLKQYLIIMIISTVFCLVALGFVLVNIDPFQDTGAGFGFFYVSLFFAFLGIVSLISFLIRYYFSKSDLPLFRFVQRSFRDALLISSILIMLLFLQGKRYLEWWNLIVGLTAIVLFLLFRIFNKGKIIDDDKNIQNIKKY